MSGSQATAPFRELRAGNLGVRLAVDEGEIDAVQALRYRIFYQELGARADATTAATQRDHDVYDTVADHLVVVDHTLGDGAASVVGTYRLIRREAAAKIGHFYSSEEYDISRITALPGPVLELGRSCVDLPYRSRAVMQLLWRGIAAYVFQHQIDLMFGCASLPGTDPDAVALELSYLYEKHLAPAAIRRLPPLVKGYLRLGGFVGDGAVIDAQFNTTDVAVVVQTDLVTEKYYKHYERQSRDPQD
jgi:putative hemolysin